MILAAAILSLTIGASPAQRTYVLRSADGLELLNVKAESVKYRGRQALRLIEARGQAGGSTEVPAVALLADSDFGDGVIEAELAGKPGAGANETARGFVGIAFRVSPDAAQYECFYLRPTNGRAEDQLRRNRSTQYQSYPSHPWHLLRKENPGVYESYVDLVTGEWTKIRIEVSGTKARLYVNGATQPTLLVNDLKLGATTGKVALWVGDGTEAYFSRVTIRRAGEAVDGAR